ncbi:hypothetical protein ACC848_38555, partial [Rhizobium johnstonii]
MGLLGAMSATGTALGPALGGLLLSVWGWPALFAVMLPSAFVAYAQCRPMAKAWNAALEGTCVDARKLIAYGIFNAAWCAAADFALALMPWGILRG